MSPAAVHISVETVNGMATQTAFFTVNAATLPASGGGSSSHCFIATAAYGSPLHPNVASLRAFRDRYLLTNAPGRAFVRLYYRISPPLAAIIATSPPLKAIVRILLTPLVLAVAHPTSATVALVTALSSGWVVMRQRRRRFTPSGHIS
jgi:hypothetical protein